MVEYHNEYKESTPALRLDVIILKYFSKQKILADMCEITYDMMSKYVSGRSRITKKASMKMQDMAGINADFVLNGNLPMMIDETKAKKPYEVRYEGNAPVIQSPVDRTKENFKKENKLMNRGIVSNNILSERGCRGITIPQDNINLIDITIDGIEKVDTFTVQNPVFIEKYKSLFSIKMNSHLVLDLNFHINDYVLVYIDEEFYLALYKDEKTFIDTANDEMIKIKDIDSIKIYGAYYSSIIIGRL